MASSLKIATILLLLCLIVTEPFFTSQAAITCGSVAGALSPCISYLQRGGRVSRACCGGVRRLVSSARTTRDRQTACRCLKSAAGSIRGIKISVAAGLPRACGVRAPYAISPRTNCARVR